MNAAAISPTAILMTIAQRAVMLRMDSVETFRGVNPVKVNGMIDTGELRWVWDFNNGTGKLRDLRFLALEVILPDLTKQFTLENALATILGEQRKNFGSGEIVRRLRLSRVSLHYLHRDGHLPGTGTGRQMNISRATLETYLRRRWIGGGQ